MSMFAATLACGGGGGQDDGDDSSTGTGSTSGATTTVSTSVTVTGGSVTATTTAMTTVGTTTTPTPEPCCTPQTVGGCAEDPAIAECVCATDRYCCEVIWDDVCVEKISQFGCGICDVGPGTVTTSPDTGDTDGPANIGPCCSEHPETGCEVPTLAECVCNFDPSCCFETWHSGCVDAIDSQGCGVCPPTGSDTTTTASTTMTTSATTGDPPDNSEACCTTHQSTGCEYPAIADCVCAEFPGCCSDEWDQTCVDAVGDLACGVCPP